MGHRRFPSGAVFVKANGPTTGSEDSGYVINFWVIVRFVCSYRADFSCSEESGGEWKWSKTFGSKCTVQVSS